MSEVEGFDLPRCGNYRCCCSAKSEIAQVDVKPLINSIWGRPNASLRDLVNKPSRQGRRARGSSNIGRQAARAPAMRYDARRVNHLDGLRGIAALTVVVFHYLSAFVPALTPDQTANPYWLSDTPLAVVFNGPFAVVVFFVLSGFVVSKAAHRNDPLPLYAP
jgi:Acyltransferase family